MRRPHLSILLLLAPGTALLAAEDVATPLDPPVARASLGEAIRLPPRLLDAHTRPPVARAWAPGTQGATTGLVVDTSKRDEVVDFFHCIHAPSEEFQNHHGWTGNLTNCNPGTVSQDLHEDTLRRINYYRAMAGLNADISFQPDKNAHCQEAALMMARNRALSHFPPNGWHCYTTEGYEAAGASNLSLGFNLAHYGPRAVDGQMEDAGNNNRPVGHRRWLLYSRAQEMGHGSIPVNTFDTASAAAIWVIGDFNAAPPAGLTQIAWPPAGHVPHQSVWARWSFGLPNPSARFTDAAVTMTRDGSSIPVTIIHRGTNGVGDPTIVWEPGGPSYPDYPTAVPARDTTFTITVSGITGNSRTSYRYDVTVINPNHPGDLAISGPANPPKNMASTYTFSPLEAARSYETSTSEVAAADWTEGGEAGTLDFIVDNTSGGLSLITDNPTLNGSASFHLAFGELTDQSFEINRPIIPSAGSELRFHHLRRWSTTGSILHAEISDDGGANWIELWSRSGNGSPSSADWDSSFQSASISLAAFAKRLVKLRFVYRHHSGSYFEGAGSGHGFYLDDITVTDSEILENESTTLLPAGSSSFTFTPEAEGREYYLRVRPIFTCREFEFGEALAVTSVSGPPGVLELVGCTKSGNHLDLDFKVTSGSFNSLTLQRSSDLVSWSEVSGATLIDHGEGSYTFRTPLPSNPATVLHRIRGQ